MTKYDQILPIMTKLMTKIYDQTAHLLNTLNKKLQLFLGLEMTVMFRWVGPLNAPSLRAQVHQSTWTCVDMHPSDTLVLLWLRIY